MPSPVSHARKHTLNNVNDHDGTLDKVQLPADTIFEEDLAPTNGFIMYWASQTNGGTVVGGYDGSPAKPFSTIQEAYDTGSGPLVVVFVDETVQLQDVTIATAGKSLTVFSAQGQLLIVPHINTLTIDINGITFTGNNVGIDTYTEGLSVSSAVNFTLNEGQLSKIPGNPVNTAFHTYGGYLLDIIIPKMKASLSTHGYYVNQQNIASSFADPNNDDALIRKSWGDANYSPSSALQYQGLFDANTGSPNLQNGTGVNGDWYVCNVAGTHDFGAGGIAYTVNDWAIYNGSIWELKDQNESVISFNSRMGVVTPAASDYDASQVDNDSSVVGAFVSNALDQLDTDKVEQTDINSSISTHTSDVVAHHTPPTLPGDIEDGGSSEMSVAGLSGELADAQPSITEKVDMPSGVGTPTYTNLKDFMDTMMSGAIVTGGVISDGGSGTIDITETEGWIKKTDSDTGEVISFKIAASTGFTLNDNALNWIYVDYNGGTPTWDKAASLALIDHHTQIVIGRAYREGTVVHPLPNVGGFFSDYMMRHGLYEFEAYGFEHSSGALISPSGTRNFALTDGVFFASLNKLTTNSFDSNPGGAANTFSTWYKDGAGWQETTGVQTIDNLQYNDYEQTPGLVTLTGTGAPTNRYGVHWVYLALDNHVDVIYGVGNYTLAQAQDATAPASVPSRLENMSTIVGKIIIQKTASAFTDTLSAFVTPFVAGTVDNHNDLGLKQGGTTDEYYHMTAAQEGALHAIYAPTFGTGAGEECEGNDSRLSDDRTPLSHGNEKHTGTYVEQTDVDSSITTHAGVAGAHHTKYTDGEAQSVADTQIATHAAIAAVHHAKYLDGEAVSAMGAKADGNPLNHDRPIQATESVVGIAEIATQAEVNAGTDNTRMVTPIGLRDHTTVWQAPVNIAIVNTPPAHVEGNRYIIGGSPTGDWSTHSYEIATSRSSAWVYTNPSGFDGMQVYDKNTNKMYWYDPGLGWKTGHYETHFKFIDATLNDSPPPTVWGSYTTRPFDFTLDGESYLASNVGGPWGLNGIGGFSFPAGSRASLHFPPVEVPKNWVNNSGVTFIFHWIPNSGGTGNIRFASGIQRYPSNGTSSLLSTSVTNVQNGITAAPGVIYASTITEHAFTGTLTVGDIIRAVLGRDGPDGTDTYSDIIYTFGVTYVFLCKDGDL